MLYGSSCLCTGAAYCAASWVAICLCFFFLVLPRGSPLDLFSTFARRKEKEKGENTLSALSSAASRSRNASTIQSSIDRDSFGVKLRDLPPLKLLSMFSPLMVLFVPFSEVDSNRRFALTRGRTLCCCCRSDPAKIDASIGIRSTSDSCTGWMKPR